MAYSDAEAFWSSTPCGWESLQYIRGRVLQMKFRFDYLDQDDCLIQSADAQVDTYLVTSDNYFSLMAFQTSYGDCPCIMDVLLHSEDAYKVNYIISTYF
jgi:hypothetical protein